MHRCITHGQTIVQERPGERTRARWRGSTEGEKGSICNTFNNKDNFLKIDMCCLRIILTLHRKVKMNWWLCWASWSKKSCLAWVFSHHFVFLCALRKLQGLRQGRCWMYFSKRLEHEKIFFFFFPIRFPGLACFLFSVLNFWNEARISAVEKGP